MIIYTMDTNLTILKVKIVAQSSPEYFQCQPCSCSSDKSLGDYWRKCNSNNQYDRRLEACLITWFSSACSQPLLVAHYLLLMFYSSSGFSLHQRFGFSYHVRLTSMWGWVAGEGCGRAFKNVDGRNAAVTREDFEFRYFLKCVLF